MIASEKGLAIPQMVLATLSYGNQSYRVFAKLVSTGSETAQLWFYRFDGVDHDEPLAKKKMFLTITNPRLRQPDALIRGIDFILVDAVLVDAKMALLIFGVDNNAAA